MFVFVDESGDTGTDFENGSTPFFIVTAVTFQEEIYLQQCSAHEKPAVYPFQAGHHSGTDSSGGLIFLG